MNKKNLSVVMAGAMLATSVAPVLADTTNTKDYYEVTNSNKGLLIRELRNVITSKLYANEALNNGSNGAYAADSVYSVITSNTIETKLNIALKTGGDDVKYADAVKAVRNMGLKHNIPDASKVNAADLARLTDKEYNTIATNYDTNEKIIFKRDEAGKTAEVHVVTNEEVPEASRFNYKTDEYKVDNGNTAGVTRLENDIKSAKTGKIFKVVDNGHVQKNGKYYAYSIEDFTGNVVEKTFNSKADLETKFNNWSSDPSKYTAIVKMEYDKTEGVLKVTTRAAESETTNKVLTYKVGDKSVDFTKPVDANGDLTLDPKKVAGFKVETTTEGAVSKGTKIESNEVATIKITDVNKKYEVALSSLYDGLFLTENGQKLLDTLKDTEKYNTGKTELNSSANGIYSLNITVTNNKSNEKTVITVKSNNEEQIKLFQGWMDNKKAPVQVLAGSNRYETAVKVAKENASIKDVAKNGNIVLVNGNSLVDGLAAAPLAASTWNDSNSSAKAAPVLLTETNGIPSVTKAYMKELIAQQEVGKLDKVTVYLVGGTSVISKSVENDLKEIGFRVVRAGGSDREATSVAVAELMEKEGVSSVSKSNAFVVGANGEADAMSIAPVAAKTKTPIIVESIHGISEDTINYLKGYKNTGLSSKDVTIIGGETSVSVSTETTLKDEKIKVDRVAGTNRQTTNAKVIDRYYSNLSLDKFIVSKDGITNKSELIDALTATSLSVKENAPIVLGTKSLSKDQINTLELKANNNGAYVYQIGYGVDRSVVKTIAEKIGLAIR